MKATIILSALVPIISAHTRFTTLFVNSQSQGDGTCIRMDMNPSTTTNFISGINSPDMACGAQGDLPVNRTCPLKPGDSISLLHRLWADGTHPGSIDPSHKGTTAVYMKKVGDANSKDPYSTSASGDGWFKIMFSGYDESSKQWGTEKMIANGGKFDAQIPSDLPGGYYLVRSEILALQNIINAKVAPQFYAGCAQVYVDSSKSGDVNAQTVSVPGYIDSSTPALTYDIYASVLAPFVEFGPKLYGSVSARAVQNLVARSRQFRRAASRWGNWGGWGSWSNTFGQSTDSGAGSNDSSDSSNVSAGASTTVAATSTTARVTSATTPVTSTTTVTRTTTVFSTTSSTATTVPTTVSSANTNTVLSSTTSSSSTSSTPSTSTTPIASTASTASTGSTGPSTTSSTTSSQPAPTTQSNTVSSSSSGSTLNIVGTCPSNTILTVANQCLTEIPSWSNDTPGALPKCWAASQQCWDTNSFCWNNLSPAINTDDYSIGCHAWESKCNAIVDWCKAGNLQGPPVWTGGNVKMVKRGGDVARRVVAAERRMLTR